jgi:hypothetical protein
METSSFSSQVQQSSCSMFSLPPLGRTMANSRRPLSAVLSSARWIVDTHHRQSTFLLISVPSLQTIRRVLERPMPMSLARSPQLPTAAMILVCTLLNHLSLRTLMHTPSTQRL